MIFIFEHPDRDWQIYTTNVDLDYYLKFIQKFEEITKPIESKKSFWHETTSEYVLKEFKNNKIRIDFSDDILTIMFSEVSDDESKLFLTTIAQTIDNELDNKTV